jgi:hypothetical protein
MNKEKIYIAGPISGVPEGNKRGFQNMSNKLEERGIPYINPRAKGFKEGDAPEGVDVWTYLMKASLTEMMECDAIVLLDGWMESRGASIEYRLALDLGMPVYFEETF